MKASRKEIDHMNGLGMSIREECLAEGRTEGIIQSNIYCRNEISWDSRRCIEKISSDFIGSDK